MEAYLHVLQKVNLFQGLSNAEILSVLKCLGTRVTGYPKDGAVMLAGDAPERVGIVLGGRVRIQREDMDGNLAVIDEIAPGGMFGEAFACAGVARIPVSVWATEETEILFLNYAKIIAVCPSACNFHARLIRNMLRGIAGKLIALNQKLDIVQKNTIREKLAAYFESCVQKSDTRRFTIPFDRNTLAEYLGVNRSAVSRELGKMRDEGLLTFRKNDFTLLRRDPKS